MSRFKTPSECPVCGASVPKNAHSCPECGADERSGWNEEDSHYDGIDLPEPEEERDCPRSSPSAGRYLWPLVGLLLLALMLWLVLGGRF